MRRLSSVSTQADPEIIGQIIQHCHLYHLDKSDYIFGGGCPFCGHEKSFTFWADKGVYRCFWCGCDGRFVRSPERIAEVRKLELKKQESDDLPDKKRTYLAFGGRI